MPLIRMLHEPGLLTRAQLATGLSQERLGRQLGLSRRTITRWTSGHGGPSLDRWVTLTRLVYPHNRALAAEIASALGETLVTVGLEAPLAPPAPAAPARPFPKTRDMVDSVVCAAAEAAGSSPQAIRPALVAAFDRVVSVGLALEEVRSGLRPPMPEAAEAKARKPGKSGTPGA